MMKKMFVRQLSVLLALVLALSAVPFVSAAGGGCEHSSTSVYYTPNDDGTHQMIVTCNADDCGRTVYEDVEYCSNMDDDHECDKCNAAMPEDPLCDHEDTTGGFVANGDGTHTAKLVCNGCRAVLIEYDESCEDTDADGACDSCKAAVETDTTAAVIECPENGLAVNGDEQALTFTISGIETEEVEWTFEASGSAAPVLSNDTDTGLTGAVTVTASNGHGVARVNATAQWEGGRKTVSAYVSFCERESYTVEVREGTKAFRFMQTNVLESVTNVAATKVAGYSIYRLLTDGCGTYVKLYEDSKLNESVASITYRTTGSSKQYDPDGYNTYSISELNALTFTIAGEGTFELKYEIQEKVGNVMFPTTRGTIKIVVGTPADRDVNLLYRTAGEPVSFDLTEFVNFWEDNRLTKEELRYVRFSVDEKAYGVLYLDNTQRGIVKEEYSFYCNLLREENTTKNAYELDGVTYVPDPREETYTEDIEFMAYGRANGVVRGTIRIVVGEKMEFTDVAKEDWFYNEVSDVFFRGIMTGVSDTEFDPNGTLTRGMVVTMLHRAAGEPKAEAESLFTDVAADAWYADAVAWAAENSIVLGMGDGTFAPEADITREQLAAILYRYAGFALMDINTGITDLEQFADKRNISDYAVEAMKWAVYTQLMMGSDNYLTPAANATRAQAAVAFSRLLK